MKTFQGHLERIRETGTTNCDGMAFDEIFATLEQLKTVTNKNLIFNGEENVIKESSWGGSREGAGRPATGRKKQNFYITDEENEKLRKYLEELRNPAE